MIQNIIMIIIILFGLCVDTKLLFSSMMYICYKLSIFILLFRMLNFLFYLGTMFLLCFQRYTTDYYRYIKFYLVYLLFVTIIIIILNLTYSTFNLHPTMYL